MEWLKGKKSYIIALLIGIRAVFELVVGDITFSQFIDGPYLTELGGALGLASLRAGVAKAE